MKILDIDPASPLFGYIRPGYSILTVNGQKIQDAIDFRYKIADERVKIIFADDKGKEIDFKFHDVAAGDLGITLDDHKVRTCKNDCIFCFIRQQPQGMRRVLYIKDEDYRLSFTHGNFVTLSNTTDEDIARIIEQRLSPIYVSVHATDDTLRRCMLKNEKLAPIIPRLRLLGENGISIHTQVVLCPGINDGPQLERTINDLVDLYPAVETLAVVPVGLTKYRDNLPNLRTYHADEAATIIDYVEMRQKEIRKACGSRFVWAADEFYVQANRPFPKRSQYEEMNQFENGIGMVREFLSVFNRKKPHLKKLKYQDKRALFLTGYSAHPFFSTEILPFLKDELGLNVSLHPVKNRFWGESVTVSGLLTGQDLLREARAKLQDFDHLVLPPNCLNQDDLFLDNLSLDQFQTVLQKPVSIGQYDLAATIKDLFL
jgi:putative radical SAM enzyme (TIGR03279 family)